MFHPLPRSSVPLVAIAAVASFASIAQAQLSDVTQTPNSIGAGIQKSRVQEIGAGRGDAPTPLSSMFTEASS